MTVWVLRGPGPELAERKAVALTIASGCAIPEGLNTHEEAEYIAATDLVKHRPGIVYVVTSAYHVPRAYLTVMASLRKAKLLCVLHVWGTGTVTNEQAQREALKLKAAQEKGHALKWEDV